MSDDDEAFEDAMEDVTPRVEVSISMRCDFLSSICIFDKPSLPFNFVF